MHDSSTMKADARVAALAEQYRDLVYAAALRQTGDAATAGDVMQGVFLVLLIKARRGNGPDERQTAGWLLQVTRHVVQETRRTSWRRRRRELAAAIPEGAPMRDAQDSVSIRETLDAALLALSAGDREAVARRYLHGESVEAVGRALGLSENAASKRIGRALEKLRTLLARRGVIAPAASLVALLAAEAAVRSPVAVAGVLATSSGASLARRVLLRGLLSLAARGAAALLLICAAAVGTIFAWHVAVARDAAATQAAGGRLVHEGKVLEENSDQLVAEILRGIQQNRQRLKTLEIDAEVTASVWFPDESRFADYQERGKGWIDARSGKFRVEIPLQRSPWLDGAAPYVDESFTEVWDGKELRRLYHTPDSTPRAVLTDRETSSQGCGILGRPFSMQLDFEGGSGPGGTEVKNDPLDVHMLRHMRLTACRELMNGRETLELATRFQVPASATPLMKQWLPRLSRRYWFDPARGYALLAFTDGYDGEMPLQEQVVDQLVEAAPGVFYPARARTVERTRDHRTGKIWLSDTGAFRASRVVANQPIPSPTFTLVFPPGVPVTREEPGAGSQPATRP